MELPGWVLDAIARFEAPGTGKVAITIEVERYQGGVTRIWIGSAITVKPPPALDR